MLRSLTLYFSSLFLTLGPGLFASVEGISPAIPGDLLTENSGLSHNGISAILQDSLGFIWVATQDGLNKYDGYSFEQFRYQPDTVSLSSNNIICLAEGVDGVLWIGTDNGLNKLDRLRGYLWTYFPAGSADTIAGGGPAVRSILVEGQNAIWVLTDRRIGKLNLSTGEFSGYNLLDAGLEGSVRSTAMARDGLGKIWIATGTELQVLDPATGQIDHIEMLLAGDIAVQNIHTLIAGKQGKIWIGTDKGLCMYDGEDFSGIHPGTEGHNVRSLDRTSRGNIIMGTDGAFLELDPAGGECRLFSNFYRQELQIGLSTINYVFEDASEILWLGTDRGLVKIDRKPLKFSLLSSQRPGVEGLSSYMISSILKQENGDLWLGTAGRGLNLIRYPGKKAVVYSRNSASRQISNDHIHAIHRDGEGNLWIGTGNGVDIMEVGSQVFRTIRDFRGQRVYDLHSGQGGGIWLASSAGIHHYDHRTGKARTINRIRNGLEIMDLQDVYSILEDGKGRIWFGTSIGLVRFDTLSGDYKVYQAGISKQVSNINSNTVYCLMRDSRDKLWIGTASGLNRYDAEHDRFEYFSDPVELSEMRIYSILEDGRGVLWMGSDRGLVYYDPELETFINYDPSDGIQNLAFYPGAGFSDPEGRMYFGGAGGMNSFHPDSIPYNAHIPPLSFTQYVRIRELGGQSKPIALDRVSKVIIPTGVQIISIRFSALDFTHPGRNRYMYKMVKKGQDGLWIHNGEQHYLTFYELAPGTYTLSILGSNNDLLYNEEEIDLEIYVPYPFWGKGLAVMLYILAGASLLYLGIQMRTRNLRRSNKVLREKETAAREISHQREELVMKNKNITDSINYAKRIQNALLPTWDNFKTILPQSFVLFKPKDIVSGDFYWINQHGNKVYIAAIDCTGHGVPGAFVSIIGFELFRKITASEQGSNPAMILDTLNENFTEIFSDGEQVYLNDGMDLSLCVIDKKEKSLDFSGAFNPLYLVRNETIIEVKADRFSLGADVHATASRRLFKSHKIYLQPEDIFYMFSDGYADQFGGPEGKKFKYRRFRHLLLTIHKLPLDKQKSILDESIEEWKGGTEQIDDILVIGIRPGLK